MATESSNVFIFLYNTHEGRAVCRQQSATLHVRHVQHWQCYLSLTTENPLYCTSLFSCIDLNNTTFISYDRCFDLKWLTVHSGYMFYQYLLFSGNWTHDLVIANTLLYHSSSRNSKVSNKRKIQVAPETITDFLISTCSRQQISQRRNTQQNNTI